MWNIITNNSVTTKIYGITCALEALVNMCFIFLISCQKNDEYSTSLIN